MIKSKLVYMFRHGETDWNREGRLQGHTDVPLNPLGLEQARSLIAQFQDKQLDVIFSSDLTRAHQTANVVASVLNIPIVTHPGLRETHLGTAEGLTFEEVLKTMGREAVEHWHSIDPAHHHWSFPGGETKAQLVERVLATLETFLEGAPYRRIGVATHGGVIRRLVHHFRPELTEPLRVGNCAVFRFEFTGGPQRTWIAHDPA